VNVAIRVFQEFLRECDRRALRPTSRLPQVGSTTVDRPPTRPGFVGFGGSAIVRRRRRLQVTLRSVRGALFSSAESCNCIVQSARAIDCTWIARECDFRSAIRVFNLAATGSTTASSTSGTSAPSNLLGRSDCRREGSRSSQVRRTCDDPRLLPLAGRLDRVLPQHMSRYCKAIALRVSCGGLWYEPATADRTPRWRVPRRKGLRSCCRLRFRSRP
jgi:hypothetical protein